MPDAKQLLSGELLQQIEETARTQSLTQEDVPRLVSEVRRENQERGRWGLRITADTNIIVSGLNFRNGKSFQLLQLARAGKNQPDRFRTDLG